MRNLLLFMHVSLGFTAGPNGEMDWIYVDEAIFDYASGRTNEADMDYMVASIPDDGKLLANRGPTSWSNQT